MIPEPTSGFTDSFQAPYRNPIGKGKINSHIFLSSDKQDGSVQIDSSNKYAQSFTSSTTFNTRVFYFFISRFSGDDSDVDIKIMADNSGLPDTGVVLAQSVLHNLNNLRPRWYKVQLDSSLTITASTKYWIEISTTGDTNILWYKDSTKTGEDYVLNDTVKTTDQSLIFRIKSLLSPDNLYTIPSLLDYQLSIQSRLDVYNAQLTVSNTDGRYNEAQPLRHLLSEGQEVTFSIGNTFNDLSMYTFIIDSHTTGTSISSITLLSKHSKLINQNILFKSSFISSDYGNVVADIIQQSKLSQGQNIYADSALLADSGLFSDTGTSEIDQTSTFFPTQGTLAGSLMDAIRKIEQVTGFKFGFTPEGKPKFKKIPSIVNSIFTLDYKLHILRNGISNFETKNTIFNRLLADNNQTSDGNIVNLNTATLLTSQTSSIANRSKLITFNYASSPTLRVEVKDLNIDETTTIKEVNRGVDSITIEIFNNNYPSSSGNYSFEIYGSTVSNDDPSLLIREKAKWNSLNTEGIIDYSVTNNLFDSVSEINQFSDRYMLYNAFPRDVFKLQTRGIPIIEVGDVIKVDHPEIDSRFIYKVTETIINYSNSPRKYDVTYTIEKYPFLDGQSISTIYLYADNGNLADGGLNADSEQTADFNTYI